MFSPPRTLNFFGYAAKKCTFPPYSDGEIYTKLSNEFKIAGIIWFRGVVKKTFTRITRIYGFGVSPKNIHTDYTDYMVSGCRQKNIHTDYTDYMVGGVASKYIHTDYTDYMVGGGEVKKNIHTDYTDYIVVVYHPDGL